MVIHSLLLKSSFLLLGKERGGIMVIQSLLLKSSPSLQGKGKSSGHGHYYKQTNRQTNRQNANFLPQSSPPRRKMEGMVVMVIHNLPPESSSPLLDRSSPPYPGNVVVYWAGSEPYSYKLSSSSGKGKGWWSWSYTTFLWKAVLLL